ncbi:MAG: mRNA interferase RelE [Candidatus Hydrogenedentes bacterium ADurb.Bin101]|nr:MAG: mRNA interferase RelE [Candidatus Hydrogenedentes bacterium ADurb.Bin101]HOC67862.1 type II toxin-antitoxin system RelE/ParE family toxin [Candidatus Hydrogenedentota bacterium]
MKYSIEFSRRAARQIDELEATLRIRVIKKIEALSDNPRPLGVQKLVGSENDYRIRIGDYRVVYEIRDSVLVVIVIKVTHRRQVYG